MYTTPTIVPDAPHESKTSKKAMFVAHAGSVVIGQNPCHQLLIHVTPSGNNGEAMYRMEAEAYRLDNTHERTTFVQLEFGMWYVPFCPHFHREPEITGIPNLRERWFLLDTFNKLSLGHKLGG
jgi:hypothetical protein